MNNTRDDDRGDIVKFLRRFNALTIVEVIDRDDRLYGALAHYFDLTPRDLHGDDRELTRVLVPVEPTPEILAAAAIAVYPVATKRDLEVARDAADIVLRTSMDLAPGMTRDMVAASIATMGPAYRAMVAAARPRPMAETECPRCNGDGAAHDERTQRRTRTCKACNGTGTKQDPPA